MRLLWIILPAVTAVLYGSLPAVAQQSEKPREQIKRRNAAESRSEAKAGEEGAVKKGNRTPERPTSAAMTAAATEFARRHHPELADLLTRLKDRNPRQYDQAVRQLFQTSQRLARVRDRDPERYEVALEAWKLDSRIRLLAARMTMRGDSQLEEELAELVRARADVRLRQLAEERDRLTERLDRIDAMIERIGNNPEAATKRELQRIKRSLAGRGRRQSKQADQPVVAPNPMGVKPTRDAKKPL